MTIGNDHDAINSRPVFTAELKPYRSLGRTGFRVLMALTFAFCFFNAIFFVVTGALPVAMFFGVDFVLLYGAFWLSYRSARAREEITLSRMELEIRKVSPTGSVRKSRYNPFWTRFDVDRQRGIRHHRHGRGGRGASDAARHVPWPGRTREFC
jgi:uncharacterized membrane protein